MPRLPIPPRIDPSAFVHPRSFVCGDVSIGPRVSVWPFAAIRGDTASIVIGADSNVQDGTVIHADDGVPCLIGARVGIGHSAIVHGSVIDDECLIAMGAILLNGVRVGTGSIIGAGAVCAEGLIVPKNSLVLGVPGRIVRQTTVADRERIRQTVENYLALGESHRRGEFPER